MQLQVSRFNLVRGLRHTVLVAIAAGSVSVAVGLGISILGSAPVEFDLSEEVALFMRYWLVPLIACVTVFACSAWATFAPRGEFGFMRTLMFILILSVSAWVLESALAQLVTEGTLIPVRVRHKGIERRLSVDVWHMMGMILPPFAASMWLTVVRSRNSPECRTLGSQMPTGEPTPSIVPIDENPYTSPGQAANAARRDD